MMYSGVRAIMRALVLAIWAVSHNDTEREIYTTSDLDIIPPGVEVIVTYQVCHKKPGNERIKRMFDKVEV